MSPSAQSGQRILGRRWGVLSALSVLILVAGFTAVPATAGSVRAASSSNAIGWLGTTLNSNASLSGVSCPSVSVCYAAGGASNNDALIERTTDGGDSWSYSIFTATGGTGTLDSIACHDTTHCIATGGDRHNSFVGTAYRTTDGVRWSPLILPANTKELSAVSCVSDTRCWASSFSGQGVMTSDGGDNWGAMPYQITFGIASTPIQITGVTFQSPTVGWVVGRSSSCGTSPCNGYIQKTIDGGQTWAFFGTPAAMAQLSSIACPSLLQCIAAGGTGSQAAVYRTTNGGATWGGVLLPAGMQFAAGISCPDSVHCVTVGYQNTRSDSAGHYVTSDAAVARSTDGGVHWSSQLVLGGLIYSTGVACADANHCTTSGLTLHNAAVAVTTNGGAPPRPGYWLVASDGGIFTFGTHFYGSKGNVVLNKPVVGMTSTVDGRGYFLVASDGGIFTFGDAFFRGSTGNVRLAKPVVGMALDPVTGGYWLVASDGGVFSFGAPFFGSGGGSLANPIVGMAATNDGGGYLLAARNGQVFAFGTARSQLCNGTPKFSHPVVAIATDPNSSKYWLVTSAGEIAWCPPAPYRGSLIGMSLNKPIVGMAADPATSGYWFDASDGGIFSFHAPFLGSTGAMHLNKPIVGMAAVPGG